MCGYIGMYLANIEQAMLTKLTGENEVVAIYLYYTAAVVASLNVLENAWLVRGSIFGVGLQIRRDPKHARASRDHVSGERKGAFVKWISISSHSVWQHLRQPNRWTSEGKEYEELRVGLRFVILLTTLAVVTSVGVGNPRRWPAAGTKQSTGASAIWRGMRRRGSVWQGSQSQILHSFAFRCIKTTLVTPPYCNTPNLYIYNYYKNIIINSFITNSLI